MINPMDLSGRLIMVTGASSGIGRETCILLSRLGAKMILVARDEERLSATLEALEGSGHDKEVFDLRNVDLIPPWMLSVVEKTGTLHGLVHCAGMHLAMPLRSLKRADVSNIMCINYESAIFLLKGFRQKRVSYPNSSVVLLSSVMGLVGQSGVLAYAGSKGAIVALTKAAAMELVREKIRVNCVAPAYVRTEMADNLEQVLTDEQSEKIKQMHPLGLGSALDVAHAVAFLLADTGRWITGTTLTVDGGYTAH